MAHVNSHHTYPQAWVTTRKGLQHHRTHRTPIKLQCFAVNEASAVEEKVGFIMLDLRTAASGGGGGGAQAAIWEPLQSTLYSKLRPELKIELKVEMPVTQPTAVKLPSPKRPAPQRPPRSPRHPTTGGAGQAVQQMPESSAIAPGSIQLGEDAESFSLTLRLGTATGLPALADEVADGDERSSETEYYFMHMFHGKEVALPAFSTLSDRMVIAQSATFRLSGAWEDVRAAFEENDPLRVYLFSSHGVLVATASVPLDHFITAVQGPPQTPFGGTFVLAPHSLDPNPPTLAIEISIKQTSAHDTIDRPGVDATGTHNRPDNTKTKNTQHYTDQRLNDLIRRRLESGQGPIQEPTVVREVVESDAGPAEIVDAGGAPDWDVAAPDSTTASETVGQDLKPLCNFGSESDSTTTSGAGTAVRNIPPAMPSQTETERRSFCVTVDVRAIRALLVGPTLATVQVGVLYFADEML